MQQPPHVHPPDHALPRLHHRQQLVELFRRRKRERETKAAEPEPENSDPKHE